MTKRDYRQAVIYSLVYKFDLKNASEIVLSMMQWLKDLREEDVRILAEKYIVPEMKKLVRPEILDELNFHRKNNARLVLLSSALPYLCEPIAGYLGMDDVVCSRLETDRGRFTGRSVGQLVFGPEKAVRMEAYCTAFNLPINTAWYYGDAYTDRFILERVVNPVCVKPEVKLRWLAKRKGWKVI